MYDLAVIGGGPGGYCAAIKAAQLGMKTVCIEKRGTLGGTCLNVGCIPSKTLLNITHKYSDASKNFKRLGIDVTGLKINWEKAQKKKDVVIQTLTKGIEGLFKKNKVDYLKGTASFVDSNTLKIAGIDGKSQQNIKAKNILIATGSQVAPFKPAKYDEKVILSSTGVLSLQKIPKSMVIVGGGVIGLEMAQVYSSIGTEVTIVEFLDRILPPADLEVSKMYKQMLEKKKIKVFVSHAVMEVKPTQKGVKVGFKPVKGDKMNQLEVEKILISTGRIPFTQGLNAQGIKLKMDKYGRIEINSKWQTNIPNIYAIGDVVKGPMLAHKAEEEGVAVVSMLKGLKPHVNYDLIPSVVYTTPEIAWVGKTEEELKAAKIAYSKGAFPFMANSRAKAVDCGEGFVKVLRAKSNDQILGVHIVGETASELISQAATAMEAKMTATKAGEMCYAHPSFSEALKEAYMSACGKALHI